MRYALYFSPPKDHPLTGAASLWLGRDAFTGETYPAPDHEQLGAAEQFELTADPRRYGFHATIKAPFSLAASVTEKDLLGVAEDFAQRTPAFEIPELVLGQLGRFFALVPGSLHQPLQDFAAKVVRSFEPFRAALSEADMARRNPDKLSDSHGQERCAMEDRLPSPWMFAAAPGWVVILLVSIRGDRVPTPILAF